MPLSRRTAGWRTTEETPPISPSYPQHKAWITQDYREQITPCLDMYFTQAGKATLWTTKREPRISVCLLPTSYLRCKTSRSNFTEARCSWPAAPFKISFPSALSLSSSLSCCFQTLTPFCTQTGATFSGLSCSSLCFISVSLFLLSATVLGKHQHCTPGFHIYHQYTTK